MDLPTEEVPVDDLDYEGFQDITGVIDMTDAILGYNLPTVPYRAAVIARASSSVGELSVIYPTALENSSKSHLKRAQVRVKGLIATVRRGDLHPNIVPILGFVQLGLVPCIASPWLDDDLYCYLAAAPDADRHALVFDVAEGLKFLHNLGIIHGNLEPSNVFINSKGIAMLRGFGLMDILGDKHRSLYLPEFTAPALFEGGKPSRETDAYSYQAIKRLILTWHYPVSGEQSAADPPTDGTARPPMNVYENVTGSNEVIPTHALPIPETPLARFRRIGWQVAHSGLISLHSHTSSQTSVDIFGGVLGHDRSTAEAPWQRTADFGQSRLGRRVSWPKPFGFAEFWAEKYGVSEYITAHRGSVDCIQFSPNGAWLATSGSDRLVVIWKAVTRFTVHRCLAHPGIDPVRQIAWSPNTRHLLSRMGSTVKLWFTASGVLVRTIRLRYKVDYVAWTPGSSTFACAVNETVYIMDLRGTMTDLITFDYLNIRVIGITQDERRLLIGGVLRPTAPERSGGRGTLLLFNLTTEECEDRITNREDLQDIVVGADPNGSYALVSYSNGTPDIIRVDTDDPGRPRLVRSALAQATLGVAGTACFGHSDDRLILFASKDGLVQIWRRESSELVYSMRNVNLVREKPEDLTCIAWNKHPPSPRRLMFAVATADGTVQIWADDN